MKIPESVQIGHIEYQIRLIPADHWSGTYGQCKSDPQCIELRDDLEGWHLLEVLIHEMLHAIYYERDLRPESDEEHTVSNLAGGLTAILHQNPEIRKLIGGMK